ncbi:efflux RND transporter periplasmic adaptor subunit [Halomonas halocynthiae]|uniref:efflux RND transporter periplasmic adaptor subunit n=1 Tax=Halomonas halocynthiae TaxID=176290 RepID=UPI0005589A45|nr:efflux RND transporter periplasmic adaptor subunit [Halomonas halocynthiae]
MMLSLLAPGNWRRIALVASLICFVLTALPLAAQPAPTPVIGARVDTTLWSDPLDGLGTLKAEESITLSATVTAIVESLDFEGGEQVAEGATLVRLNAAETRADLRAAQALRDERQAVVNRLAQLQERNLAPRAEVEDSRAQLRQAEAAIAAIQAQLDNYTLNAPFAGVVGFRELSVGTLVTPGTELVTLDKLERMKLDIRLPERELGQLTLGTLIEARSSAYPEALFQGSITNIGTRVDPVSRSVVVRAELDNPEHQLRPGMLMEARIKRDARHSPTVPESAVIAEGLTQHVLVIHQDDMRIERREITQGKRRHGEVEVLSGLQPGELVVSHGTDRTRDGATVRLIGIADADTSVRQLLETSRTETNF